MAEAVMKVIEDEKVSRSSGKDFGLVILGLLTSPRMLAGRLGARYQNLRC